jgi:excisionase family DNA binding protein
MTDDELNQLFPTRRDQLAQLVPLVLTIDQAAERLGVGRTIMYALVSSGAVESVKIGRLRRLPGKGARYEIISAAQREEG